MKIGEAPEMSLDQVSYAVTGTTLLHPLTLQLGRQGLTGIIGQNGSGKSTLLRILAGQHAASAGTIRYAGRVLSEWSHRAFARVVGYLPQQLPTTARLTVRELVAYGRYPWHGVFGRFGESDRAKVDEALELTGMMALSARFLETLSGGERQRAWLTMLVAQEAKLLLLDEPIAALDIGHQLEVLGLLRHLSDVRGVASVVVIHEINMATRFCDRILALRAGRLVSDSEPESLLDPVRLESVYGVSMGIADLPGQKGRFVYPVA